ncbi:MAG: ATP-binding protein, partial [Gammaproteobacteria bacterium]|nr:ATP-binding protein [Gammaproteobacteria bacterium]
RLIEQPVKNFPLRYTKQAVQRVLNLTRAHPALVQLLCGQIIRLKNAQTSDKRLSVLITDVEAAAPGAFRAGEVFFAELSHNQADANGCRLLCYIAECGEGKSVPHSSLRSQFPNNLDKVLRHLLHHELLEATKNGYQFQVELVRRWFARLKLEIRN